ncbi:MAG: tRNA lysidine(34) synthetase TilS [Phycisphaeraceae bacterium]
MRHRCGLAEGGRVIVAVSGGCDSVALLLALHQLAGRRGWDLDIAAGHVQHHLRDAAEEDARFVEDLVDRLDIPFLRADLDLPREGNLEANARQARYAALGSMAETFSADAVASAHSADDQLETLLMRLLRGSSVRGLRGIAWRRRLDPDNPAGAALIRPMLGATRAHAADFLRSRGQGWREDPTNADLTRLRARLRHEVLPLLRDIQPAAAERAVHLAGHFRELSRLVDTEAERHHEHALRDLDGAAVSLDRNEARMMPGVVLTTLLRRLLEEAGVPGDRLTRKALAPITRAVRDQVGGERRFDLARGVTVRVTRQEVEILTGA